MRADPDSVGGPDQRPTDKAHARNIAQYIVDGVEHFGGSHELGQLLFFAEEDQLKFNQITSDNGIAVGRLIIRDDAQFAVGDGQHRTIGIHEALEQARERARNGSRMLSDGLHNERIGLTLVVESESAQRQQIWHDINDTPKAPNKSIALAFDSRSPLYELVMHVRNAAPVFGPEYLDIYNNSPKRRDRYLYSVNQLGTTVTAFVIGSTRKGKAAADRAVKTAVADDQTRDRVKQQLADFFGALCECLPGWVDILQRDPTHVTVDDVMEAANTYVHFPGLGLNVLGLLGYHAVEANVDLQEFARTIARHDWRRKNPDWLGNIVVKREVVAGDGTVTAKYTAGRGGDVIEEAVRKVLRSVVEEFPALEPAAGAPQLAPA